MTLPDFYRQFVSLTTDWHVQQQVPMLTWAADDNRSACIVKHLQNNEVEWQPVLQSEPADFANVEHALELKLHDDIKTYYQLYFGAGLCAQHSRGKLMLLQVWDDEDNKRLQENIIGHIIMKRRLKQRETVFFATTEDDDILLSVLNSSGEVYLEHVGQEVREKLADSLAQFFSQLSPCSSEGL